MEGSGTIPLYWNNEDGLYIWNHLILTISLWCRTYYHPHLQRRKLRCRVVKQFGWVDKASKPGFKPRQTLQSIYQVKSIHLVNWDVCCREGTENRWRRKDVLNTDGCLCECCRNEGCCGCSWQEEYSKVGKGIGFEVRLHGYSAEDFGQAS